MSGHAQNAHLQLLDELDDWQRGFIDAVFSAQGIDVPTQAQCTAALKRMTAHVINANGGELPPDGRISRARRPG